VDGLDTYSFSDYTAVVAHPSVGQKVLTGAGIGDLNVTMANDVTTHDVAADGAVMISKIKAGNGALAFNVQHTSDANEWFQKWYNYLTAANSAEWAKTTVTLRNNVTGIVEVNATGVSPQKRADKNMQAQGQRVMWNLMAKHIDQT
jgi:hypothetical protein